MRHRPSHPRVVLRRVLGTGRAVLIAGIVVLVVGPAVFTWVSGQDMVRVIGGSMEPTYMLGDIITLKPPTGDDLVLNAVITINDDSGALVTHRIIAVNGDEATTQGDANNSADTTPLVQSMVVGVVTGAVGQPLAGVLHSLETLPARISLLAVIGGLAILPLPGAARSRRADSQHDAQAAADPHGADQPAVGSGPDISTPTDVAVPPRPAADQLDFIAELFAESSGTTVADRSSV
ncbi:signal peptidase I [Cryobacterium melibiosiphilum]|nr:signal peptidase I [Cryobacterium melibiosiphilum]